MPGLRQKTRGDACYQVAIEVPAKLTAKQRELLEEFARTSGDGGPLVNSVLDRMKKLLGS
jgi:molecular chaperone DnaJ